jgi:hypothetical protein
VRTHQTSEAVGQSAGVYENMADRLQLHQWFANFKGENPNIFFATNHPSNRGEIVTIFLSECVPTNDSLLDIITYLTQ